jgi:quinoprotein dehydrogenase-associated probable ABC transporter substrate-binding protein
MSSHSEKLWVAAALVALTGAALTVGAATKDARTAALPALRVCADPNNLPFSNEAEEGFENELAELLAEELGQRVEYTWQPQRRGFIRTTLRAGRCDVVMGVPSTFELALTTNPYYRSTYVFVQRSDAEDPVTHMDDPALRTLRVGVPVVGDDYSNTPGAAALARRGIIENVKGYSVYGNYDEPHPPSRIIEAVAAGDIDVAIAWGPLAGYFAGRQDVPLRVTPVSPQIDPPFTPFVFDMSMGVRRGEDSLRIRLEEALEARRPEVRALLERYHVPLVLTGAERAAAMREERSP